MSALHRHAGILAGRTRRYVSLCCSAGYEATLRKGGSFKTRNAPAGAPVAKAAARISLYPHPLITSVTAELH
jgi:hypothetical protein